MNGVRDGEAISETETPKRLRTDNGKGILDSFVECEALRT